MLKSKNMNIEIMRIISMLMILILHFLYHGNVLQSLNLEFSIRNFIIFSMETISIIAVNIYVLISGYFLSEQKFKFSKIVKVFIQTYLYSTTICIFIALTGVNKLSFQSILNSLMPLTTQAYWFINTYLMLLLIFPFLNILIRSIDKKRYKLLLLLLLILNSIIPLFTQKPVSINSGNSLIWFINLYLIAAYIRKYSFMLKKEKLYIIYLINFLIHNIIITYIYYKGGIKYAMHFYQYNTIFVLISSLSVFLIALSQKRHFTEKTTKIIKFFSTSTLAVYLITDNRLIRKLLWNNWIDNYLFFYKPYYLLYILLISMIILILCILMDKIMKVFYSRIINLKYIEKISKYMDKIYEEE